MTIHKRAFLNFITCIIWIPQLVEYNICFQYKIVNLFLSNFCNARNSLRVLWNFVFFYMLLLDNNVRNFELSLFVLLCNMGSQFLLRHLNQIEVYISETRKYYCWLCVMNQIHSSTLKTVVNECLVFGKCNTSCRKKSKAKNKCKTNQFSKNNSQLLIVNNSL